MFGLPSKRTVSILLAAQVAIVWTAVVFRIDRFPLTWAPMYAIHSATADTGVKRVAQRTKKKLETHGWRATHRDGTQSWISRRDINVPRRNMWRLYYQRTFGVSAPKIKHVNSDSGNFDRWIAGLEPGEPWVDAKPRRDLLISLNKTLGHEVDDSSFVTKIEADFEALEFDTKSGEVIGKKTRRRTIEWRPRWSELYR